MIEPNDVKRYERELRAMLLRAGDEDPEGFAQIAQLITEAFQGLALAANLTRAQHGYSWRELAAGMGESSSTVHARYQLAPELPRDVDADVLTELIKLQVRGDR